MRPTQAYRTAKEFVGRHPQGSKTMNRLLGLGAIGLAGAALFCAFDLLVEPDRSGYVHASGLGKRGFYANKNIEGSFFHTDDEEHDAKTKAIFASGTYFHEVMQEIFGQAGATSEEVVYDDELGLIGHVDITLEDGTPVEVKTISSTGFDRLSKPLETHASQLNFYMHATKQQYGYVLYLDAMDISKNKVFRQGYAPGRLKADVDAVRSQMLDNPSQMTSLSHNWLANHSSDPAYMRGIRHSSGPASAFASIRQSAEFPGGRISSIVQASKYRPLSKPAGKIPTMGLTIRQHEVAIGHRSRGGRAKRAGRSHCNGSRSYRC